MRAWLHPFSSDLLSLEALVVRDQPTGSSDFFIMTSNPAKQFGFFHQFLHWHQEIEAKQEEQARQMAELQDHATHM